MACGLALALFWFGGVAGFARDFASLWSIGRYAPGLS